MDDIIGMPTHDVKNEPLNKSVLKKLQKEHSKQSELYEKFIQLGVSTAMDGSLTNVDEQEM